MPDEEPKEREDRVEDDLEVPEDAAEDVKGGVIIHGAPDKGGKGDIIINYGPNKGGT